MRLKFTKMHGLGNDFVVLDATAWPLELSPQQLRFIADRHLGVGCDQILQVEAPRELGTDFYYRIFNADGGEVEQCGNGARCFVRYVRDKGLTAKNEIRVGMGNPHAVQLVENVDAAPVASEGALIETHARFPQRTNAGYMQVVDRGHIRLRVYERGAGETLSCGTGACAAVVSGIVRGLLDTRVAVSTRGGGLGISWAGEGEPVMMTGPAVAVFEGEMSLDQGEK